MKKYMIVFLLIIFVSVSLVVVAIAQNNNTEPNDVSQGNEDETDVTAVEVPSIKDESAVNPDDVVYINSRFQGSGFENNFTVVPENGEHLEVYVQNNHDKRTVKLLVTLNNGEKEFGYYEIGPNDHHSVRFKMSDENGMTGEWEVYVTSEDGHRMDIDIRARQF